MKRKLLVLLILVVAFGIIYSYDYYRSTTFHIETVSISPDPIEADGQTEAVVEVRLTDRNNKPVQGHNLFAVAVGGGMLKSNRETTDENGIVKYYYYPFLASEYMPAQDVTLQVSDESNSVIFEIGTKKDVLLHLVEPTQDNIDNAFDVNAIFDE